MVVDDDDQIHQLTRMVLRGLTFEERPINLVEAYSAREAKEKLKEENDIALILLDVVMETTHAGLELVEYIRNEIHNGVVRIILRTGQPGEAPEKDIIQKYQINDYKTKTELTVDHLYTAVFTALRSYHTLKELQEYKVSLEEQVEERTQELKTANKTLNQFFSIIAHDLRKPFNGLIGLSRYLEDQFDQINDEEKKECLELIHDTSLSTHQLLENLLSWAKMQSGKLTPAPRKFDLVSVWRDTQSSLMGSFNEKELNLTAEIPEPFSVTADPDMIATILRNLLSNAQKFTPRGGSIVLKAEADDQEIRIIVADSGVGMDPQYLEKLFTLDNTESRPGTEKEEGSGLGLILCREMAQQNGGSLTAASTPGQGSVFTVTLPAS